MNLSTQMFFAVLVGLGYLVAPVMLIWGWVRWVRSAKQRNLASILSFMGFFLATASGLLAIFLIVYAQIHRFGYYDPLLMRIFKTGVLLSGAGVVFAVGGVWKTNLLRWHAPISAVSTLAFWLMAAAGE